MSDDCEKARQYAQTHLGIEPVRYGAYLDGRLSLREELAALKDEVGQLRQQIGEHTCDPNVFERLECTRMQAVVDAARDYFKNVKWFRDRKSVYDVPGISDSNSAMHDSAKTLKDALATLDAEKEGDARE